MENKDSEKLTEGEKLFFALPKEIQNDLITNACGYLGHIIMNDFIDKYPMIINKQIYTKVFARLLVVMTRTHPRNEDVEHQDELMKSFLIELEKECNTIPYWSKIFRDVIRKDDHANT